jgi:hypothetical protein
LKKTISGLLVFFTLVSSTGCITDTHRYSFPYEYTEVTSMIIYNTRATIYYQDLSKIDGLSPVKTIDSEYYKEIMESIEDMKFNNTFILIAPAPSPEDSYYGYLLRVKYNTGVESLLCDGLRVDYYSSNEIERQSYGRNEGFDQLLKKYLL